MKIFVTVKQVPDTTGKVAVDEAGHIEQMPQVEKVVVFDHETDYTANFVGLVDSKISKGDFAETLLPLYVRKSQAEENK